MAGATNKKTWVRVIGSRNGNGEISVAAPIRGWIRRARCSAAGAGNVTLTVGETSAGAAFAVVLEYGSTVTPLDEEEDPGIFYQVAPTASAGSSGTIFLDVTGTGVVSVQLDIEPAN